MLRQASDDRRYSLDLLDLATTKAKPLLPNLATTLNLQWSSDGQKLTFDSWGEYQPGKPHAQEVKHYTLNLADGRLHADQGDSAVDSLLHEDAVAQTIERRSGEPVHDCSLNAAQTRAVCIAESPMLPPEVVSVVLKNGDSEAKPTVLTHLNPEYDLIQLGEVSALTWSDQKGQVGSPQAGLILPVNYVPGRRYPLLVILYNTFSERRWPFATPAHVRRISLVSSVVSQFH